MSTPAVGSSRISSRGSCTSARAIMSLRFMPPDSVRAMASRFSQSCSCLRYFSDALAGEPARHAVEAGLVQR